MAAPQTTSSTNEKQKQLAQKLRENLLKRKTQQRKRSTKLKKTPDTAQQLPAETTPPNTLTTDDAVTAQDKAS